MTVFDNMAFGLKLEKRSKDEINERVKYPFLNKFDDLIISGKEKLIKIKTLKSKYSKKLRELKSDLEFIKESNIGGEFMSGDKKNRVHNISNYPIYLIWMKLKF